MIFKHMPDETLISELRVFAQDVNPVAKALMETAAVQWCKTPPSATEKPE